MTANPDGVRLLALAERLEQIKDGDCFDPPMTFEERDSYIAALRAAPVEPVYYRYRTKAHGGDWNVVLPHDVPKDKSGWQIQPLVVPLALPAGEEVRRATIEGLTLEAWSWLVEKDDRTSPEEYPDMALITIGEVREILVRALSPSSNGGEQKK